jgi:RNA-directed DNA polymerase
MPLHNLPNLTTGTNTVELHHLFDAYYNCRANKRNTINAIAFEVNYEHNLVQLYHDINNGTYTIGKSIAFVVDKPVKREIFAADFRDRIVHHYLINALNPYFETQFIHDSYGCRAGKGTHFGIARVAKFMRQCSLNYTAPCYVLKLDIQGFFMSINKDVLYNKLVAFIRTHYLHANAQLIINLCQQVIYNNPTQQCVIKGKPTNWNTLPLLMIM